MARSREARVRDTNTVQHVSVAAMPKKNSSRRPAGKGRECCRNKGGKCAATGWPSTGVRHRLGHCCRKIIAADRSSVGIYCSTSAQLDFESSRQGSFTQPGICARRRKRNRPAGTTICVSATTTIYNCAQSDNTVLSIALDRDSRKERAGDAGKGRALG